MSDPVIVTGCLEPVFGASPTCAPATVYYSVQQSGSCPADYGGGPFIIPAGRFTSTVSQTDADAPATASLNALLATCALLPPDVDDGSLTVTPGASVSFQIIADHSPVSYSATLPSGLSINTATGLITGTASATPGNYSIPLFATNAGGTGTATLALTVVKSLSVVLSIEGSSGGAILDHVEVSIDGSAFTTATIGDTYTAISSLGWRAVSKTGNISGIGDMNVIATLVGSPSIVMGLESYAKVTGQYTELLSNTWSWDTGVTGAIGSGIQYGPQVSESSTSSATLNNSVVPSGTFSSAINLMSFSAADSYGGSAYMDITTAIIFETLLEFT